ncbi:MAG: SDR family NAD(P)-dependent oxidoreductase, partial [Candidatus Omnitrophica bacterium]|nr:SDR family NAD(P)-dependent oxidoreductase [Candidatus Omnitrophota bacterium]
PFEKLRLRVPTRAVPWPKSKTPAKGGVNAFSFGGSNAHILLQEPPAAPEDSNTLPAHGAALPWQVFHLSAAHQESLKALAARYVDFLKSNPSLSLHDLCAALSYQRSSLPCRLTFPAQDIPGVKKGLAAFLKNSTAHPLRHAGRHDPRARRIVFVFSGIGPGYGGTARALYENCTPFRQTCRRIDRLFREHNSWSVINDFVLNPKSAPVLNEPGQAALFTLQAALVEQYKSLGITPDAVIGHSIGEAAAAYAAGILSLEDAVQVVRQLSKSETALQDTGDMLAVGLSYEQTAGLIASCGEQQVTVAAQNGPQQTTLSGDRRGIRRIAGLCEKKNIYCKILPVGIPLHSPQMTALKPAVIQALKNITLRKPRSAFYSTVTGSLCGHEKLDAAYWYNNIRNPVLFSQAAKNLLNDNYTIFIELNHHAVLCDQIKAMSAARGIAAQALPSLQREENGLLTLLKAVSLLHEAGHPVDFTPLLTRRPAHIDLPLYPFQRENFWLESPRSVRERIGEKTHPFLKPYAAQRTADEKLIIDLNLDCKQEAYLKEHRIQEEIVFPGSGHAEIALAAAAKYFPGRFGHLRDIRFTSPLYFDKTDLSIPQVKMSVGLEDGRYVIYAPPAAEDRAAVTYSSGQLCISGETFGLKAPALRLGSLKKRLTEVLPVEIHRLGMKKSGFTIEPGFLIGDNIRSKDNEIIMRVTSPGELRYSLTQFVLHPVLLDSAFSILLAYLYKTLYKDGRFPETVGMYLPSCIGELKMFRRPVKTMWCYAKISQMSDDAVRGDIWMYTAKGEAVCAIRGAGARRVGGEKSGTGETAPSHCYAYRWEKKRPPAKKQRTAPSAGRTNGRYLICSAEDGITRRLVQQLRLKPEDYILMSRTSPALDFKAKKIKGIIYAGGLALPDIAQAKDKTLLSPVTASCMPLLKLLRLLERAPREDRPLPLWIITANLFGLDEKNSPNPLSSPLWGLGRVIAAEKPQIATFLCNLDRHPSEEDIRLLAREITHPCGEHELFFHKGKRYCHRLLPLEELRPEPRMPERVDFKKETFLIKAQASNPLKDIRPVKHPRLAPQPHEVEIRVEASGIIFKDILLLLGRIRPETINGFTLGEHLGLECAGTVTRKGSMVRRLRTGDRVTAFTPGSLSRYVTAPETSVARLPPRLSFPEAAAIPTSYLTAYYALHELAKIRRNEKILIHSASGGVGLAAISLARLKGAEIFAGAGSAKKRAFLRSLGIKHVFNSRDPGFADEIRRLTGGRGLDVVINTLSGSAMDKNLSCLCAFGRYVELGKASLLGNKTIPLQPFQKNLSFYNFDIAHLLVHNPRLIGAMLTKIMKLFSQKKLSLPPVTVYPLSKMNKALGLMMRAEHIGKLVIRQQDTRLPAAPPDKLTLQKEACYLVTGGCGGFGLKVAQWLSEKGAGHLVLLGRRGLRNKEARKTVAAMRARGLNVHVRRCDVTDSKQLKTLFSRFGKTLPPLKGIFHAAMVLRDAALENITPAQWQEVLSPKITGSWHLHTLSSRLDLDYFVLFSSAASAFGNAMQASYVAANSFLDALASYRRAKNLPVATVNWGLIKDTGVTARNPHIARYLEEQGWQPLTSAQAMLLLEKILLSQRPRTIAFCADRTKLARRNPEMLRRAQFSSLLTGLSQDETPQAAATDTPLSAGRPRLKDEIRKTCAGILETAPERLSLHNRITDYGFDSLMAAQLQHWIRTHCNVEIPIMVILRGPTIEELSEHVIEKAEIT